MRDVHAFLALAGRGNDRTVYVHSGLFEEFVRLTLPDLVTSLRKGFLKCVHLGVRFELPTKISGGGRVGNSCCAECIEIGFVTAFEFEVFKTLSIRQRVVCDVEYMIRFVIRKVKLQQLDVAINRVNEPALSSKRMHQP